jgi:hypothetical protein
MRHSVKVSLMLMVALHHEEDNLPRLAVIAAIEVAETNILGLPGARSSITVAVSRSRTRCSSSTSAITSGYRGSARPGHRPRIATLSSRDGSMFAIQYRRPFRVERISCDHDLGVVRPPPSSHPSAVGHDQLRPPSGDIV